MSDRTNATRRLCPVLMIAGGKRYCDSQCAWYVSDSRACACLLVGEAAHAITVELEHKERTR
jgi:hypothetical protein